VIQRDGAQIPYVVETCIEFLQTNNGGISFPFPFPFFQSQFVEITTLAFLVQRMRRRASFEGQEVSSRFLRSRNSLTKVGCLLCSCLKWPHDLINIISGKQQHPDLHVGMIDCGDPHVIAGVLKLFFQEQPEPLIPYHLFDGFMSICESSLLTTLASGLFRYDGQFH